jgi:hypothetical protein
MRAGLDAFCMCTAWNAAAQARATFSVALTSSLELTIVGVEMRKRGCRRAGRRHAHRVPSGIAPWCRA